MGRGPMTDIWPRNTLKSWGSSSKDQLRRWIPRLVIYRSGFSSSCVGQFFGASVFIVRNLYTVKIFLFFPRRFCLKSAGPLESCLIIRAITSMIGDNMIIPILDKIISSILFIQFLYISLLHLKIFFCIVLLSQNSFLEKKLEQFSTISLQFVILL